jgi:hypothetical protein
LAVALKDGPASLLRNHILTEDRPTDQAEAEAEAFIPMLDIVININGGNMLSSTNTHTLRRKAAKCTYPWDLAALARTLQYVMSSVINYLDLFWLT